MQDKIQPKTKYVSRCVRNSSNFKLTRKLNKPTIDEVGKGSWIEMCVYEVIR